ncbi:MAG: putative bifunctional diguanylate cyclase/phosphodiesterase [Pelagibaca sp.]
MTKPEFSGREANAPTVSPAPPIEIKDLKRAFERGDLLLHYQPQVDISHFWPKITGYEALARWPLPDGRFVPPDRFIPLAEDCGFAVTIDMWVIDTVSAELARMQAAGAAPGLCMSANVSPQQFGQAHFARAVNDILAKHGVDPTCLTLEITERAVLDRGKATLDNIFALDEMGVSLALDDFGKGYSSLSQLRDLPIHEVKLDRTFISELPHSQRDVAIVSSTINLAYDLGLHLVAEGVELACQAVWLRSNGCRTIQGFLYGRPAARS